MALFRQIESVVNRIDYRLLHERLGSLPQILLQQLQALADSTLEKCRNLHETCLLRRWTQQTCTLLSCCPTTER